MAAATTGSEASYMLRSVGGGGTLRARRPSRPAAPMAAAIRYGLALMSASRSSMRRSSGTRMRAVRLFPAHVAAVGDHVAPDEVMRAPSRLYELTVGLVSAVSAGAWASRPAVKESASGESPCISGAPPLHRFLPVPGLCSERCAWQPEPVSDANGLGINVARSPARSASERTMYLKSTTRSAVTRASSKSQLISNWPLASSWSAWYGPQPSCSMCLTSVEMSSYRRMSACAS
mmetsp:Transcript_16557/g.53139  ORF Transcript_16557/g.53139 Transcript_16557/m.53139 type:complete len:233 (+) Transcript_16557:437-1135(+)